MVLEGALGFCRYFPLSVDRVAFACEVRDERFALPVHWQALGIMRGHGPRCRPLRGTKLRRVHVAPEQRATPSVDHAGPRKETRTTNEGHAWSTLGSVA